jgi:SAM-dependent methyltransferase
VSNILRTLKIVLRSQLVTWLRGPPLGEVSWGSFRRLRPINPNFGFDRGQPIDRYYIERFLADHSKDICGHVLEVADNLYTKKYGREVVRSDVVHPLSDNPKATIIADLTHADVIPSDTFDCVVFTQTLQFIYDMRAAIQTLFRVLKPGGVLLATLPGISQIDRTEPLDSWGDYWRFTSYSARKLLESSFPPNLIEIETRGNVLASVSFLHGLVSGDLTDRELDFNDPDYQMLVTARAVKPKLVI